MKSRRKIWEEVLFEEVPLNYFYFLPFFVWFFSVCLFFGIWATPRCSGLNSGTLLRDQYWQDLDRRGPHVVSGIQLGQTR